ncbi:hypothetical protein [Fluviicola sp.]|uniref:hypothetical protein n=1 Tax=Fluviicola sp. TaxID=1917219 RepID=UPI0031CE9E26
MRKAKEKAMEALMIINSILVAVTLYFIKEAHRDFKEMVKKVGRLEEKVKGISAKLNGQPAGTPKE